MYTKFRFINPINDLTREEWGFILMDTNLYLDSYSLAVKPSEKSRTFKTLTYYDRIDKRRSNMLESDVVLTDEIKNKALETLMSSISIKKWSDRNRK